MGNKCETGNVKRFFLLLLGSFLSLSAWAQTGVICGTVSDAKFKDALIGASVVIEGTTVGAIADVEGNFRIENVKPGKYTIVASYVSYKSETCNFRMWWSWHNESWERKPPLSIRYGKAYRS